MFRRLKPRSCLVIALALLPLIVWAFLQLLPSRLYSSQVRRALLIAEFLENVYDVHLGDVDYNGSAWRNIEEVEWTSQAVSRIAQTIGGAPKFRASLGGPLRVSRVPVPELRAFAPPEGQDLLGDIVLTDYNFDHGKNYAIYLIVHEIGHVLDWRSQGRMSGGLIEATGAQNCPPGRSGAGCAFDPRAAAEPAPGHPDEPYAATSSEEYWAEVFATTTYPEYYAQTPENKLVGPETQKTVRRMLGEATAE